MVDPSQFKGKVVIVTGGGSGIGAATAIYLAARGAKVTIAGRRENQLHEIQQKIEAAGGQALAVAGDVSKIVDVERLVQATVAKFGALHYAVNNAGISSENHDLPDLPESVWQQTIDINLTSIYYCLKYQLPAIHKSGGGAIVNISSVFGDKAMPMRAGYNASKHAVRGITRSAAVDWARRGIRINELMPGVIVTPMTDTAPEETEQIKTAIAMGRMGTGDEIAAAVAFLLSDEASYITGVRLPVDGGFLA